MAAKEKRKGDAEFQEWASRRRCSVSGCTNNPAHGHHLIPKSACHGRLAKLRHDTVNCLPLCFMHHNWAHDHPEDFDRFLKEEHMETWAWKEEMLNVSP